MATMDIFSGDAFTTAELTAAINEQDFQPSFLRSLGLFTPRRVRTETVMIESKKGVLSLIQSSQRGAPLEQRERKNRDIRDLRTVRIAKGDKITASELSGIRAFGSETELMQVQAEVADRLNGPAGLVRDVEMTWENLMLGAVQGKVLDADDAVIYDYFSEFGVSQDAEIDFDLDNGSPASGAVRKLCNQVQRQMKRAAQGARFNGIMGIAGDSFWDDLTAHEEVRQTYLNTQAAAELRNDVGNAFESFRFGNIIWTNYQGTDDNSTVAVDSDKVKFFPIGGSDIFQMAFSPGEFLDVINMPGQELYALTVPDRDRNAFVDIEVYSYPLPICTRPKMLQRGKRT